MGITISEVIDNQLLSQDVIDCIPTKCEICGSEIEFTDSLKQVYCPNRFCALKIAARLEAMAKAMKIDGWGESTCQAVCVHFKFRSPYQVFLLEDRVAQGIGCPEVPAFEKKVESICDRNRRKVKLWEVVRLAGIPSIETIAYKIFDGYNSITEAYDEIEKFQVPFIADKLGHRNSDTGVMAVNIYNTLKEYKDELLFGETQFEVYQPTGQTFYIAITGGIQGFTNKSEYIAYLNKRYAGKINAMYMNSVTHSVHALVADGDTSSNKVRTAARLLERQKIENDTREEHGEDRLPEIIITDSKQLIKYLDENFLN